MYLVFHELNSSFSVKNNIDAAIILTQYTLAEIIYAKDMSLFSLNKAFLELNYEGDNKFFKRVSCLSESKGLPRSLSVGDILYQPASRKAFQVLDNGFESLENKIVEIRHSLGYLMKTCELMTSFQVLLSVLERLSPGLKEEFCSSDTKE
jgi:chaperonin cofactor prefoldin